MESKKNKSEIYKIIIAIIISVAVTFSVTIFGYYHYLEKKRSFARIL